MKKTPIRMTAERVSFNELFPNSVAAKIAEGVSDKTVIGYRQHWKCIGKHLDRDQPLSEVTQDDISKVAKSWVIAKL